MATREATNKLLEMIDECGLDAKDVVVMCLKWMSEDDVKEMCEAYGISYNTFRSRIRRGLSLEEALTIPLHSK